MAPYHAINAADLIITKFSSIALEGMLFERPVVSIILDGEDRFRLYGDAVESVSSLEDLNEILTMLVSDASKRADWEKGQLKNQASFLKDYFGNDMSEAAQRGAEVLDKFLIDKKSNLT